MQCSSLAELQAHYADLESGSFRSRCSMVAPGDLAGKRVLDVCCRRGKGAFALSDLTGEHGFVLGVDPNADDVAVARVKAPDNHWAGPQWERYLRFETAYPEDLSLAGVCDASFDVVYINCVLNCVCSLPVALAEFARVLVPGGKLWVGEGVFRRGGAFVCADKAHVAVPFSEPGVADPVFADALSVPEFEAACRRAGFATVSCSEVKEVVFPDDGVEERSDSGFICSNVCAFIPE